MDLTPSLSTRYRRCWTSRNRQGRSQAPAGKQEKDSMLDDETKKEMLNNIVFSGNTTEIRNKPIIGGNISHILNLSSGSPRIQTNVIKRFEMILSQPQSLSILNPFEIRCCLCKKVVSYPCWYYSVKYAVNHFHYFVCFDTDSIDKPSTKCYRRS